MALPSSKYEITIRSTADFIKNSAFLEFYLTQLKQYLKANPELKQITFLLRGARYLSVLTKANLARIEKEVGRRLNVTEVYFSRLLIKNQSPSELFKYLQAQHCTANVLFIDTGFKGLIPAYINALPMGSNAGNKYLVLYAWPLRKFSENPHWTLELQSAGISFDQYRNFRDHSLINLAETLPSLNLTAARIKEDIDWLRASADQWIKIRGGIFKRDSTPPPDKDLWLRLHAEYLDVILPELVQRVDCLSDDLKEVKLKVLSREQSLFEALCSELVK